MAKKFKLTSETKVTPWGTTLFRIEAIASFSSVSKGDKGGYVEKESNVSHDGNAWVSGNAWVYGDAEVSGNAWVYGDAEVYGNARVYGNAQVSGNAEVSGNARVYGNAWVSAKKAYTKGWFIGGDDSGKVTNITDQTGSGYWKAQYVLGDYEIKDIEEEKPKSETIVIGDKKYQVTDELKDALKNLKESQ